VYGSNGSRCGRGVNNWVEKLEKNDSFEFDSNPVWKTRKESFRAKEEYHSPINGNFRRLKGKILRSTNFLFNFLV
jgi:hypothetical protein